MSRPVSALSAIVGGGNGGSGSNGNGRGGNGGSGGSSGSSGSSGWGRMAALTIAGGVFLAGEGAAWAGKKETPAPQPQGELTVEKVTDVLWNLAGPILTNLGFSGCVGAAAGYALKKVGQFVAVCVGLLFLLVQGLAYTGFITVNWSHVHSTVSQVLDVNKDGKIDHNDFKPLMSNFLGAISQGVPSVGGFLAGFLLAIRTF